jgi:hypothetical protein
MCTSKNFTSSSACKNVLKSSLCLSSACEAILLMNRSRALRLNSINSLLNRNFSECKQNNNYPLERQTMLALLFSHLQFFILKKLYPLNLKFAILPTTFFSGRGGMKMPLYFSASRSCNHSKSLYRRITIFSGPSNSGRLVCRKKNTPNW